MRYLLLTLGHNSSAVLVGEEGQVLCGYEEERLTKVKADSSFPYNSIQEIQKYFDIPNDVTIYISHWFIDGSLPTTPNKWYDQKYLYKNFKDCQVISLSADFTYHDAHAYSALAFCGKKVSKSKTLVVVADGFGNYGETMSIYWRDDNPTTPDIKLHHRSFGFSSSLGLLFQYATSFLGLKENQDEYKLLGYEAHITDIVTIEQINTLNDTAVRWTKKQFKDIGNYDVKDRYDPLCSIDALPALKLNYREHFKTVLDSVNAKGIAFDSWDSRVIIAYYVQKRIELAMRAILTAYAPFNVIAVGGLFMNVKLNNSIAKLLPPKGKLSIMPLSGDQGAAIGIYHSIHKNFKFDNLYYGKRDLSKIVSEPFYKADNNLIITNSELHARSLVLDKLKKNEIVNVVRGAMEFGSRALCHTTTLALPTLENIQYINKLNGRSTIMPMAPVIRDKDVEYFFKGGNKIVESLKYMITTLDFNKVTDDIIGAAHKMPLEDVHTGRPQTISRDDEFMWYILTNLNPRMLINTSFNIHGKPIVFDGKDVLIHHNGQMEAATDRKPYTIVIVGE